MSKLAALLESLDLSDYLALFTSNDIDDDMLSELSNDDLKEIGIASLGHRKRIISALQAEPSATVVQEPAPLESAVAKPAPASDRPQTLRVSDGPPQDLSAVAERREVTTVFADLSGYTRLSRELETEDLHEILRVFYDHFDAIVNRHGGTVERHIGDCVMAVFGAPISYGNDAEHALRASLEMHKVMPEMTLQFDRELSVHIGVASGNVLFSSQGFGTRRELDFSLTGDSVNLAARLADQAEEGQTLITESIWNALAERIECDQPGQIRVKGFDEPVAVRRFIRLGNRPRERTLIGREQESARFTASIDQCLREGAGKVIAVVAEAGLGKSALLDEFERIAQGKGFESHKSLVLDFGLADIQDPIRALLGGLCGTLDQDPDTVDRRVRQLLDTGVLDEQSALYLTLLLGGTLSPMAEATLDAMGDEVRFDTRQRAIGQLLRYRASSQPLLLMIEDLHWADLEVMNQVAHIARETHEAQIILVLSLRPEKDPLDDSWSNLTGNAKIERFQLAPLDYNDALKLAQSLVNPPSEEVLKACITRAEGNPLFLDQLLKHAQDESNENVPGSIQSIVQSRLDKLELTDRAVLEAAAILGQRFSMEDVKAISRLDQCDDENLIEASLIRALREGYLFSHALIRDAILRTILRDNLQALHKRAASLFRFTDSALYADHLAAAGDEGAGAAYLVAATKARAKHRKESALSLADRGLEHARDADTRCRLLDLKGDMLRDLGQGEAAIRAFQEARTTANNPADKVAAQIGIIATMRILDRVDDAMALLDETQALAESADLKAELSEIHYYRGSLCFPLGQMERCLESHNKSLNYAQACNLQERKALALSGLGDAYYAMGKVFTAHKVIEDCLKLCDVHGLVAVEAANRFMLATVKIYMNQTRQALDHARASSALAQRVGHTRAEIVSRLTTGWILASMADNAAAETEINTGLEKAMTLGAKRFEPFLEETLADIAIAEGDLHRASSIAEAALLKVAEVDAQSFIGPWVLSTAARAASDPQRRQACLAEGEALLADGCVSHNYFRFYRNAIDACLQNGEFNEALRYVECLKEYDREEPTPWSEYYVDRGLALIDHYQGKDASERLRELRERGEAAHLLNALPAIDQALTARP